MKTTKSVEVDLCDLCGKEAEWSSACLHCGKVYCYDCRKLHMVEYTHAVYCSGSGDGDYCRDCDTKLKKKGTNELHSAYLAIHLLKAEQEGYYKLFEKRRAEVEGNLKRLQDKL